MYIEVKSQQQQKIYKASDPSLYFAAKKEAKKMQNDEIIWNYLISKGLTQAGAAGLMGNLFAESGLNPKNLQNSYEKKLGYNDETYTQAVDNLTYTNFVKDAAGYGLAQWTYWTRKQRLLKFAKQSNKSVGDLDIQLDFLMYELQGSYRSLFDLLRTTDSVKEASKAVLIKFEKPADQSLKVQKKRASYGESYYNKFASKKKTSYIQKMKGLLKR